jgi:hypothetical protein
VPSEPTKRPVRLYPADDFLENSQIGIEHISVIPWALSRFNDGPVGQHDGEIDHPVFHRAIAHGVSPAAIGPDHASNSSLLY